MVKNLILIFIFSLIFLAQAVSAINITLTVLPNINATIFSPSNITYTIPSNGTVNFSFKAVDSSLATFNITAYLNGNIIYDNSSYVNDTTITFQRNFTSGGTYNFTIFAEDVFAQSGKSEVFFNVIRIFPTPNVMLAMIPTVMGAGSLMWLVGIFIGSPRNPRELIEFALLAVVVFFAIGAGITIIGGLI